jgi:uncharacterized protein YndB with AHSA1/START domain
MDTGPCEAGRLADIDCYLDHVGWALAFRRDLACSPSAVWALLTEPALLQRWTPYTPDRNLGSPGPITMRITGNCRSDTFAATVIHAEPPAVLEYSWGDDRLRWDLEALPTGTRVTLQHTFATWEWAAEVATGWHLWFDVAEQLLDGCLAGPGGQQSESRYAWRDLHDAYAHKLICAGWHDVDPCPRRSPSVETAHRTEAARASVI